MPLKIARAREVRKSNLPLFSGSYVNQRGGHVSKGNSINSLLVRVYVVNARTIAIKGNHSKIVLIASVIAPGVGSMGDSGKRFNGCSDTITGANIPKPAICSRVIKNKTGARVITATAFFSHPTRRSRKRSRKGN